MIEREEMNYDDFTLRDVNRDELSGSLAPFTLVVVTLFLSGTGGEKLYRDFTIQVCRISYYPAIIPHKEERK